MLDTHELKNKISAFRQRLEQMPRLTPESIPRPVEQRGEEKNLDELLKTRMESGSRTQALLEQSLRQLTQAAEPAPALPAQLTARARRLLTEAHGLIGELRQFADDPLLAGPAAEESGSDEIDPLALFYRDSAAMMEPAVRIAQNFPDVPSVQLRLCDGLDGILAAVRRRIATLQRAREIRRHDTGAIDTLARLLTELDAGRRVEADAFGQLAEQILADSAPLRFVYSPPIAARAFLGGPSFEAPARFVAGHSLTAARVMARMIRRAPEWRNQPHSPIIAALLHDVAMLRVPVEALMNPHGLTEPQRRAVEAHARAGAEVVANLLPEFSTLVEAVGSHHERLDGTGYPAGLKGEQITAIARLLAVADTYAALGCSRPHRPACDPRTALTDTLLAGESGLLDRYAAEKLMNIGLYPVGSVVELAGGAVGVVAGNHQGGNELYLASRPVLNVLIDERGDVLPGPQPVDLAEADLGVVVRTLKSEERARLLGRHYPEWCV